jgi:hypothetical protein
VRSTRKPKRRRLSPTQNKLLTKLERVAIDIGHARELAVEDLRLEREEKALRDEADLKRPPTPNEDGGEYADVERRWNLFIRRLDIWILENLKSGDLMAFGVPLPITPSTVSMPIPTGLWRMLALNVEQGAANSEHWLYSELRVVDMRVMGDEARELVADGLWVLGTVLTEQLFAEHRRVQDVQQRAQPVDRPAKSPRAEDIAIDLPDVPPAAPADDDVPDTTEARAAGPKFGPWSAIPKIADELRRRAGLKICKPTWRDENLHLFRWAKKRFKRDEATKTPDPPTRKTIRNRLAELYYELNPESPRPRRTRAQI